MLTTHLGTLQDPELLSIARGALIDAHLVAEEYVEADALITQQLATAEGDERRVLALQQIRLKLSLYDPVGAFETYQLHFEKSVDYVQQPEDYLILRKLALDLRGSGEFEPAILVLERSLPLGTRRPAEEQRLPSGSCRGPTRWPVIPRTRCGIFDVLSACIQRPRTRRGCVSILLAYWPKVNTTTKQARSMPWFLRTPWSRGNLRYQAAFELAQHAAPKRQQASRSNGHVRGSGKSGPRTTRARADALYRAGEMLLLNQDFLGAAARFQQVAEIESPLKCRAQFKAAAAIYAAREYGEAVSAL